MRGIDIAGGSTGTCWSPNLRLAKLVPVLDCMVTLSRGLGSYWGVG